MTDRPLIVLDVNETLLDIDALEPLFDRIFSKSGRMREWFAQLILYSQALSLSGTYVPFGDLGAGVLRMLGQIHGVSITEAQIDELSGEIGKLPVHQDVPGALRRMKDTGFALVTLTNTPPSAGPDALERAGLDGLFDRRFTVDPVRRFKPASETYRMVADAMQKPPADIWMIAAHTWDTIGAQKFGWQAALLTRGVNAPLVLDGVPQPTMVATDLGEAADKLIETLGTR